MSTVRPNRIRRASGCPPSGRHPKRHRETVVRDTSNAFANAFPDEEPTEYGRCMELEILTEVAREEREGRRDDEQRQLVGLIVREGVNNFERPVGRCGVVGCNFPTL